MARPKKLSEQTADPTLSEYAGLISRLCGKLGIVPNHIGSKATKLRLEFEAVTEYTSKIGTTNARATRQTNESLHRYEQQKYS